LLDRIDLHVEVGRVALEEIAGQARAEDSAAVAARVVAARRRQHERQACLNARVAGNDLAAACAADATALDLLARAMRQLGLSARAYHRVLRVARTIADLAASGPLRAEHVAEAITLRQLDRRAASEIDAKRVPGASRQE
jgi:magnesium chelatase family protein